jgi:Holliday junction resolvase RusA-like endonuclease
MITVTSSHSPVSLNQLYTMHWGRKALKKESLINSLTLSGTPILGRYTVLLRVNNRLDLDNNVGMIKIILDYLRRNVYLTDDSPKFMVELSIVHDAVLPRNFMEMTVTAV